VVANGAHLIVGVHGVEFECDAILLDLDGVLVDSTECVRRQWSAWAKRHGLDPDETFDLGHGLQTIDHIRMVAPYIDAEAESRAYAEIEAQDTEGIVAVQERCA
jgi:mannitol-1-/sugar-/sorbitol-6-phosphatase